jgi:hypothetical protein
MITITEETPKWNKWHTTNAMKPLYIEIDLITWGTFDV